MSAGGPVVRERDASQMNHGGQRWSLLRRPVRRPQSLMLVVEPEIDETACQVSPRETQQQ